MRITTLATIAALFLTLNLNPSSAQAGDDDDPVPAASWSDKDQDSVQDSDEPTGCVDTTPIPRGAMIQLTGPRAGCWTSPRACIAHRLNFGGGDARSCGALDAPWGAEDAETVRGLDFRLDRGGRLVQVDGTLVAWTATGWACTEPQAYLYAGGKVTKSGKDAGFAFFSVSANICMARSKARKGSSCFWKMGKEYAVEAEAASRDGWR